MKKTELGLVGLLFACYLAAGLLGIRAHTDPGEMDTAAYLRAAHQIKETGGIFMHLPNLFTGIYREATQHPAYLLFLSVFAERSVQFFIDAKILTYFIGLIFLAVLWTVTRKLFGPVTALLTLALTVGNATFIHMTTMVACESLMAVFFVLFWYAAAKGFEKPRWWLAAGAFAAATYLTKSLGIFTLPIFFVSAAIHFTFRKKNIFKERCFWGFFLVFFIVAGPLFARNLRVWGTPFYSNSTAVMWIDRWHDYDRPDIQENPPTMADYLKEHTFSELARIFFEGLTYRTGKMVSDGLKPLAFWEKEIRLKTLQGFHQQTVPWQGLWASALVLLALIGLRNQFGNPETSLTLASFFFFIVFVAWYSKVFPGDPPTRLLYVIFFPLLAFAAEGLCDVAGYLIAAASGESPKAVQWPFFLTGIFAVFYLFSVATHVDWKKWDIRKSFSFGPVFQTQMTWASRHLKAGDAVLVNNVFINYLFYFPRPGIEFIQWPQTQTMEELQSFVKERSVRYAILDLSTVVYNLEFFKKYFIAGPSVGMRPIHPLPPPFRPLPKDPGIPPIYEIYELVDA